jgi:hypothetical protein
MGNTAHQPTLKRGVTHTTGYDQREATHQPMTSAQNMHAYQYNGLPFQASNQLLHGIKLLLLLKFSILVKGCGAFNCSCDVWYN